MDQQQLCDQLCISHSVDPDKEMRATDLPKKIHKVSGNITLSSCAYGPCLTHLFLEMETPLGNTQLEHFTLEVLPKLL